MICSTCVLGAASCSTFSLETETLPEHNTKICAFNPYIDCGHLRPNSLWYLTFQNQEMRTL